MITKETAESLKTLYQSALTELQNGSEVTVYETTYQVTIENIVLLDRKISLFHHYIKTLEELEAWKTTKANLTQGQAYSLGLPNQTTSVTHVDLHQVNQEILNLENQLARLESQINGRPAPKKYSIGRLR